MIIVIINLFLTLAGTALFLIFGTYPQNIVGTLMVLGVAVGLFFASMIVLLLLLIVVIYTTVNTNKKSLLKHNFYNQFGFYIFNFILRVKVIVTGRENLPQSNRFVTISNHIEYTDPIYMKQIFKKFPMAFVSKEELFRFSLLRYLMLGTGCISLHRGMARQGLQAILDTVNAIKNGQPMAVFAEGTRSYSNEMIPFKAGSFKLATKAEADIVPVCLYDMHGIFRRFRIGIQKCYIHVLPVIPYKQIADMDTNAISVMVQNLVEKQMKEFKAKYHN